MMEWQPGGCGGPENIQQRERSRLRQTQAAQNRTCHQKQAASVHEGKEPALAPYVLSKRNKTQGRQGAHQPFSADFARISAQPA